MEEIFQRSEKKFSSIEEQIGWLSSFDEKKGNAYEKDAVKVATELQRSIQIVNEAKSSSSVKELDDLSVEANNLKFNKENPIEIIDTRRTEVVIETIEVSTEIEEVEKIDTKKVKELKKAKKFKLKNLESRERAIVRIRLIEEISMNQGISEDDAERIVNRDKLVTQELGPKKY